METVSNIKHSNAMFYIKLKTTLSKKFKKGLICPVFDIDVERMSVTMPIGSNKKLKNGKQCSPNNTVILDEYDDDDDEIIEQANMQPKELEYIIITWFFIVNEKTGKFAWVDSKNTIYQK